MRRKKGFTIPELLAVIVILGILSTIAISSYNGLSKSMKQKTLENKLEYYKEAAYEYASDAEIENDTVTIGYLAELGYIDLEHPEAIRNERIDNPVTGEYLDCRIFSISKNLDDYDIVDTGEDDCNLAETEHQQADVNAKAYIYIDGKFTDLTNFEVSDNLGDFSSEDNSGTNVSDTVSGVVAGAIAGAIGNVSSSGSSSGCGSSKKNNTVSGAVGSAVGSVSNWWKKISKKWNWSNFFHIFIPVVNAETTKNNYITYPWSKSDVYVFFDFNSSSYSLKNGEVTYDIGSTRTNQSGKICDKVAETGCANVFKVENPFIFDNYVTATVNTKYGKISKKVRVRIDKDKPKATIQYSKEITKNNVQLTIEGNDGAGSGIAGYYFGTSSNPTAEEFNTFNFAYINSNGTYYYAVVDKAGNISDIESVNIDTIDKDAPKSFVTPTSRDSWSKDDFTFKFGCSSDTRTGCAKRITYSIKNDSTNSYIVKDKTVAETEVSYTVTTPSNTQLKSVTLEFTIYDNIDNASHKYQTITTNIDKIERRYPTYDDDDDDDDDDDSSSSSNSSSSSSSGGGGSGGSGGGCHGALECGIAGAVAGATVGSAGGVAGAVAGAVVGGVVGAVIGANQ